MSHASGHEAAKPAAVLDRCVAFVVKLAQPAGVELLPSAWPLAGGLAARGVQQGCWRDWRFLLGWLLRIVLQPCPVKHGRYEAAAP